MSAMKWVVNRSSVLPVFLLSLHAVLASSVGVTEQSNTTKTINAAQTIELIASPLEDILTGDILTENTLLEDTLLEAPELPSVLAADTETAVGEAEAPQVMTYNYLYEQGIKNYLDNDWHACVRYLEEALKDYHWYTDTLVGCRRDCKAEAESATPLSADRDITEVFYENAVRNALCLLKCRADKFGARKNSVAPISVDRDFDIRKPYDYLQLCYYKIGRYQDAASAAVTVLATQPDHSIMVNNLKQYIDNYSADTELLVNQELKEYGQEYVAADRAHIDEDYEQSVLHMEAALNQYWTALEDCRLQCEEPFDQGWFPDFVSSVANHFTFTFRCKRKCPARLSNLYGEEVPEFVPSMLNYLQYGYSKMDNISAACSAVESFLELLPTDPAMLRNKQFYLSEYQKIDKFFKPRKEVLAYAARERYEESLLHFIDTEFVFLEEDRELNRVDTPQTKSSTMKESIADMLKSIFKWQPSPSILDTNKGEL